MMEAKGPTPAGPRDEEGPAVPFVFVPHGDPLPAEWMNRHPGWVRIPAVMVPRDGSPPPPASLARPSQPPPSPSGRARPTTSTGTDGTPRHPSRPGAPPAPDRGGTNPLAALRDAYTAMDEAPTAVPVLLAAWRPAPAPPAATPGADDAGGDDATAPVVQASVLTDVAKKALPYVVPLIAGVGSRVFNTIHPPHGASTTATPVPAPGPSGSPPFVPPTAAAPSAPFPARDPEQPAQPDDTHSSMPTVLPGPTIDEDGPSILEARGKNLVEDAQGDSKRARRAVMKDPSPDDRAVLDVLVPSQWWVHHLIPVATADDHDKLVNAAASAGWKMDEPANLAVLPNSEPAQKQLEARNIHRPIHNNNHKEWSAGVDADLRAIEQEIAKSEPLTYDEYARRAKDALEKLQPILRRRLEQEEGRVQ